MVLDSGSTPILGLPSRASRIQASSDWAHGGASPVARCELLCKGLYIILRPIRGYLRVANREAARIGRALAAPR